MHPGEEGRRRTRPGRLGLRDIEQLEETAKAFRAWDHRYGGGLRRRAVLGQLSEVATVLDEHQAPAIEERLYRVLAQLAGTAATMAWDSGLQRRAQDYYRLSLRAAHAGGDRLWGANVLAGMARQDPRAHVGRAGEEIRQALAERGPEAGRSNALDRLGLAEVYFLGGDLTAGCQETHAALDVAERVQSGRVREGMTWLYSYTVGHGASRPVREARARLREQLSD